MVETGKDSKRFLERAVEKYGLIKKLGGSMNMSMKKIICRNFQRKVIFKWHRRLQRKLQGDKNSRSQY
jgi:hypothetical protein